MLETGTKAPAFSLPASVRQGLCNAALQIMNNVKYVNAGTVEFLVTPDNNFYFIEVNPRVQVEHTITEMITGIDVVQTQIKIAEGYALDSDEIGIYGQESVQCRGNAIQCRITTEDPMNNFMPDSGKLMTALTAKVAEKTTPDQMLTEAGSTPNSRVRYMGKKGISIV